MHIDLKCYTHFSISPANEGISQPSRVVIYDRIKGAFSLIKEIDEGGALSGSFSDLADHFNLTYKIQIKTGDKWYDKIPYKHLCLEKKTSSGLKYMFFPKKGAKNLVIIFQAINRTPGYNYIGTLSNVNAHRLYIKDDYGDDAATKSSYYLGKERTFSINDSVIQLIHSFCESLNLTLEQCITAGSSKGGFSAIYTGIRLGAGSIIAGGPQILLGHFLNSNKEDSIHPPILKFIAGDNTQDSVRWANSLLPNLIKTTEPPHGNLFIHAGSGDPHYKQHVLPFVDICKNHGFSQPALDIGNYQTHADLAKFFPEYLSQTINHICTNNHQGLDA